MATNKIKQTSDDRKYIGSLLQKYIHMSNETKNIQKYTTDSKNPKPESIARSS